MKRNILIDANNLFHRAHAIYVKDKQPSELFTNNWGYPTGLIYGTYSMLQDWLGEINNPTRIIFFMDGIPKRRLAIDSLYKYKEDTVSPGKSPAEIKLSDGYTAPNELKVIFRIAYHLGIDVYFGEHEEADDLIASFIKQNPGDVHIVISSDKDFYQLLAVYNTVILYRPGVTGNRMFDAEKAAEHLEKLYKVKIEPSDIMMFKALTGDPSDGIKGVPRLRKRVIAPLCRYQTVEDLFATGLPKFSKKEKENTLNMKERIAINLELVKLIDNLDVESFRIMSKSDFNAAQTILSEDLDIRAVSADSFRTTPKQAIRVSSPAVPDWLSDI